MLIHAAKQAVIIRPRDIAAIQTAIPHSRRVTVQGHQMLAIPHRVDETRVLRNLGCRVPSPILSYYDWPRSSDIKAPFLAQRATAAFMTLNPRAHIHNGLGSGKSLATLWAYDYLRSAQLVRSMLVIAPLSTLTPTWAESIEDHFPHLRVVVLYGTKQTRLKLLELPADIYVVNHDGAVVLRDNLAAKRELDVVVVDEIASAARNPRTNRWKAINAIINAKRVPIRWGWGLTGTPIPNEPTDAYGQAKLLTPETAPKYYNKFRDSVMKQVSQFRWVARPEALDVVKQVLTPAIRFSREECVDLPPTTYTDRLVPLSVRQQHAYDEMRTRLVAECAEGKIVAVNEAVKASKLLQIACLAYDTEVLTDSGWFPIQNVESTHAVWDGEEWVCQGGAIYKGHKPLVVVDGVRMTSDHKVWLGAWVTAQEILDGDASSRLNRPAIRLPYGYEPSTSPHNKNQDGQVDLSMRLWKYSGSPESVPTKSNATAPEKLRLPSWQRDAQNDEYSWLQNVDRYASSLLRPIGQRLQKLRRSWDLCVRALGLVPNILGRYGRYVRAWVHNRPTRQRWELHTRKLSLGYCEGAEQQQAKQSLGSHPQRAHDISTSGGKLWAKASDVERQARSVRVAATAGADRTYDLVNCGPRNRFVVRGASGQLLLVHNCGVAYDAQGEEHSFDADARLKEVLALVQASESKTLVFVPFVSAVGLVSNYLESKGVSTAKIYGAVSKADRDRAFGLFQHTDTPRVLVCQPAAMSHGLTLTRASTIVWYAPTMSAETYEQANGRITRPGQTYNTLIIHVGGTDIERRIYTRLKHKQSMQGVLLDMIRRDRE